MPAPMPAGETPAVPATFFTRGPVLLKLSAAFRPFCSILAYVTDVFFVMRAAVDKYYKTVLGLLAEPIWPQCVFGFVAFRFANVTHVIFVIFTSAIADIAYSWLY